MIKTDKEELLIGLIGDTHIPSQGPEIPELIINDFKKKKIDYLFHLGDYTELKVLTKLQEIFGKDKVIAIIAPIIIGGMEAKPVVAGNGVDKMIDSLKLKHVNIKQLGGDLLVSGYVKE